MARQGLPAKYVKAGGGFTAKAWRLWRSAKAAAKKARGAVSKKIKRKKSKSVTTKKKGTTMAKKKGKAVAKRTITFFNSDAGKAIVNVGGGTGMALGSTAALEYIPMVKEWPTWGKASTQAGIGLLTFFIPV